MEQLENKARYDFYRLYRVHLETEEHVQIFKELEERCDSVTFYGHARHPDQYLTIMIAAHKIADFITLLERYNVSGVVLVSGGVDVCLKFLISANLFTYFFPGK